MQERDLVGRFNVSISPIRDALLKLEEQGLIEVLPRKGYRVRRIDISDVCDMHGLRQIVERVCIALLIESAPAAVLEGLEAFRQAPPSLIWPPGLTTTAPFTPISPCIAGTPGWRVLRMR